MPEAPGFEVPAPPSGGGGSSGGGSSGGSSSSSTSGGGSTGPSEAEQRLNALESAFERKYFELWGTLPPPNYVNAFVKNMNIWEFERHEMRKPAWWRTPSAKKRLDPFAKVVDTIERFR